MQVRLRFLVVFVFCKIAYIGYFNSSDSLANLLIACIGYLEACALCSHTLDTHEQAFFAHDWIYRYLYLIYYADRIYYCKPNAFVCCLSVCLSVDPFHRLPTAKHQHSSASVGSSCGQRVSRSSSIHTLFTLNQVKSKLIPKSTKITGKARENQ